jgi:hypothetical protein
MGIFSGRSYNHMIDTIITIGIIIIFLIVLILEIIIITGSIEDHEE